MTKGSVLLMKRTAFAKHAEQLLYQSVRNLSALRLSYIPAKVRVIDYYRETFECRTCRKNGGTIYGEIPNALSGNTTFHGFAINSCLGYAPKVCQCSSFLQTGEGVGVSWVKLSRATMANWIIAASRDWLTPLVELMHKKLLEEKYLHADETTVQVMNEEGRRNTTDSYMWVYSSAQHSPNPIRIFEYQPGRGGKYPQEFLKGFKGYLHTDAYAGYKKIPGIIRCMCWKSPSTQIRGLTT